MTNEKKQIKEMAKDLAENVAWDEDEIPTLDCLETAKRLYLKDYRKTSDVAREIFEEIEKIKSQKDFIVRSQDFEFGYAIALADITELKKKYEREGK